MPRPSTCIILVKDQGLREGIPSQVVRIHSMPRVMSKRLGPVNKISMKLEEASDVHIPEEILQPIPNYLGQDSKLLEQNELLSQKRSEMKNEDKILMDFPGLKCNNAKQRAKHMGFVIKSAHARINYGPAPNFPLGSNMPLAFNSIVEYNAGFMSPAARILTSWRERYLALMRQNKGSKDDIITFKLH